LRSTDGRPFVSRAGGQIGTQNVVILPVTYSGGVGQEGAAAQLLGHGTVIVLRAGTSTLGTWERSDIREPMVLRTPRGDRIDLPPGHTWVELPDTSYTVDVVHPPTASTATRPATPRT
jgi:Protein of unknown function (DUF3048) C-terminal domain